MYDTWYVISDNKHALSELQQKPMGPHTKWKHYDYPNKTKGEKGET